jgi:GT2 family glycosyltransferase
VDNNSSDNTVSELRNRYPDIRIIANDSNLGYAKAINIGVKNSDSEYLLLSNADVIYEENGIETILTYLEKNPTVGVVGVQQTFPDGSWQYSYGDLPGVRLGLKDLFMISTFQRALRKLFWNKIKIDRFPKSVGYADGGSLFTRSDLFKRVGGFDEDYFFYTEEADYCYKVQVVNFYVIFYPKVNIIHLRGGSSENGGKNAKMLQIFVNSKMLFCKKHFSKYSASIFKTLEFKHSQLLYLLWTLLIKILPNKYRQKAENKQNYFETLAECWKQAK